MSSKFQIQVLWNRHQRSSVHMSSVSLEAAITAVDGEHNPKLKNNRQAGLPRNGTIARRANNGRIENARYLFDKMSERDVMSETVVITEYAQSGRIEHARQLFDQMSERNIVSWNAMMSGYAKNGRIAHARELFEKMPERDVVSWTGIIVGYAQKKKLENARQLFERMPERNVISWTAMITAYAQNWRLEEARWLFDKMPEKNTVSWTAMITGYVKDGRIDDAHQLFYKMPYQSVISWNAMIAGYVQSGRMAEACQLFDKMPERNVASWNAIIAAYFQDERMAQAQQMFDEMPKRNVVSWTAMVAGYCQNGRLDDARKFFDKMPERNVVSWNAMVAGYAQSEQSLEAFILSNQMQRAGIKWNESTFTSVLSACCSLATLERGKQVHEHLTKTGFDSYIFVASALINMYAKCGSIADARQFFDKMPERDVVSWNTIIAAYAHHGHGKEALQIYEKMQLDGTKPNNITFINILSACSHAGLIDEGWHYFDSMHQIHFITPRAEHYACIIDLLGRNGSLDEAYIFVKNLPCEPNTNIWGALLGACRIHGNIELGKHAAEHLLELESQNAGIYVLLSNIYAAAGRWNDVRKVRQLMKQRGVIKKPSCSWIEVKNKVHSFIIGDKSHPETGKIYATLERLTGQMEESGYVPDTNFVLHDVEEEQKEYAIRHHSERLAIAYGLSNTPNGTLLRIFKNLRMCGDCHTAFKFISNIVGREIVVRDANRFHHFKDGLCSCGDYW